MPINIIVNFLGQVEPVDYQILEAAKYVGGVTAIILGLIWLFTIVARGVTAVQLARIQLEAARQKQDADGEASDNEVTKSLIQLLAHSSQNQERTANILAGLQPKVEATAEITAHAKAHYASTEEHQKKIEPILLSIKTTIDNTDLKVGELHTTKRELIDQFTTLNGAVVEFNKRFVEYLEREKIASLTEPSEPRADAPQPQAGESKEPATVTEGEAAK